MRKKKAHGTCHICLKKGKLSFEHVPPRSAFNDRPLVLKKVDWLRQGGPEIAPGRRIQQRGAGGYTLCERCNNQTGIWYGAAYAEWAEQGLEAIDRSGGWPGIYYRFNIYPLRVLKQIVCMFFSANRPGFARRYPDLVDFVLSKDRRYIQPDVRIYALCTKSRLMRQTGQQLFGILRKGVYPLSEITFPPFGYVMFLGCKTHDPRLYDISFFGEYAYREQRTVPLPLPILPVVTPYPGDYRTPLELVQTIQENIAHEREQKLRSLGSHG